MRLNGQIMSNIGGNGGFSAGAAVSTSKTKKYVCVIIKLNFLSNNLSSNYKDKPRDHCVRKCVSLAPSPLRRFFFSVSWILKCSREYEKYVILLQICIYFRTYRNEEHPVYINFRFHVDSATWLTPNVKYKLLEKYGKELTKDGWMVIKSDRTR